MSEEFRTLYCDPGERFGWALGKGFRLLAGGTTQMWNFTDQVWAALAVPFGDESTSILNGDTPYLRNGVTPEENTGPIGRFVVEDFRIYPWKCRSLAWDPVRTARVIGALKFMARVHDVEFVLQPASIKRTAQAAGAEELYYHPLHENRHQNDAIQHFSFYTSTTMRGVEVYVPESYGSGK